MLNLFLIVFEKLAGKEVIHMIIMGYATLIMVGNITFTAIPTRYQPAVKAKLAAMGLDENGDILML